MNTRKTTARPRSKIRKRHFHGDIDFNQNIRRRDKDRLNPFDVLKLLEEDPDLS